MIPYGKFEIGDMVEITWYPPPKGNPPTSLALVVGPPEWDDDFFDGETHRLWRRIPVLVNGNRVLVRDRWCTVVE